MGIVIPITRKSEASTSPKAPLRSDRYFKLSDYWYFITREGATLGPYESKDQAQHAVVDYIQFVNQVSPAVLRLMKARPAAEQMQM